jgi:hypothetical protein
VDWRSHLQLTEMSGPDESRHQYDVLFLRKADGWFARDNLQNAAPGSAAGV